MILLFFLSQWIIILRAHEWKIRFESSLNQIELYLRWWFVKIIYFLGWQDSQYNCLHLNESQRKSNKNNQTEQMDRSGKTKI